MCGGWGGWVGGGGEGMGGGGLVYSGHLMKFLCVDVCDLSLKHGPQLRGSRLCYLLAVRKKNAMAVGDKNLAEVGEYFYAALFPTLEQTHCTRL